MGVINRRFVFSFYNSFGGDPEARKFFTANGGKGYGALFTPDGKCLGSFGFNMSQVYQALKKSKAQAPDYWQFTEAEKAVLKNAADSPNDVEAQVDAARLHAELLDFPMAEAVLSAFIKQTKNARDKATAEYWLAHHRLAENDLETQQYSRDWNRVPKEKRTALLKARQAIREKLAAVKGLPKDLEDDRAIDLLSVDIRLAPKGAFYTGWELTPNVDGAVTVKTLKNWIEKAPESNRIGQMYFLLGLAHQKTKDLKSANAIWKKHYDEFPADRFAMLSRFHHSSYKFAPQRVGSQNSIRGGRSKPLTPEEVERQLKLLEPKKTP